LLVVVHDCQPESKEERAGISGEVAVRATVLDGAG
jgi:hypothetical protein